MNLKSSEKLEGFLLRSGPRQRYFLLLLIFNIILEVLANAVRLEQEIKDIKI